MAVMLRAEGVPARVVSGFAMGEYDYERSAYRVPAAAAHAWVEVYFSQYGWVEFEPTSARSPFEYRSDAAPSGGAPEAPARPTFNVNALRSLIVFAIVLAGLVVAVGAGWWWISAREPSTPRRRAQALYGHMRRALARAGLGAPASLTPYEYLVAHTPTLTRRPLLHTALLEATRLYLEVTFSPHAVSDAQIESARRLWRRAALERVRLWRRALRRKPALLSRRTSRK
jgi:hypothetical protein